MQKIRINGQEGKIISQWWTASETKYYAVRFEDGDVHHYSQEQLERYAEPISRRALEWQQQKLKAIRQPF